MGKRTGTLSSPVDRLLALLEGGRDDALLRLGLASACLGEGSTADAITHAEKALEHDPTYSAAWKLYAQALVRAGREDEARAAYDRGIEVAARRGDVQAEKEMRVFRRRLGRDRE